MDSIRAPHETKARPSELARGRAGSKEPAPFRGSIIIHRARRPSALRDNGRHSSREIQP